MTKTDGGVRGRTVGMPSDRDLKAIYDAAGSDGGMVFI